MKGKFQRASLWLSRLKEQKSGKCPLWSPSHPHLHQTRSVPGQSPISADLYSLFVCVCLCDLGSISFKVEIHRYPCLFLEAVLQGPSACMTTCHNASNKFKTRALLHPSYYFRIDNHFLELRLCSENYVTLCWHSKWISDCNPPRRVTASILN